MARSGAPEFEMGNGGDRRGIISGAVMTLTEALKILQTPAPDGAATLDIFLACGFTPLHLKTLLEARLRQLLPDRRINVSTGLYGDLAGSVEQIRAAGANGAAVIVEWEDLDPRLGRRRLAAWSPQGAGGPAVDPDPPIRR